MTRSRWHGIKQRRGLEREYSSLHEHTEVEVEVCVARRGTAGEEVRCERSTMQEEVLRERWRATGAMVRGGAGEGE